MKSVKILLAFSLMIVGFLLAGTAAMADPLTITLSQPFQSGVSDDTLDFYATVTNTTGQTLYLNGDDFTVDAPLVLDDSPYDINFPYTLGSGDSADGLLFTVYIPPLTSLGLYEGNFEITGGYDSEEDIVLGSANFDVYVTPEPSSLSLLGAGLLTGLFVLGGTLRRRQFGSLIR